MILMNHVQQLMLKKNYHAKFLYTTHLISAPTWLKWFNFFLNLILSEGIKNKGSWDF